MELFNQTQTNRATSSSFEFRYLYRVRLGFGFDPIIDDYNIVAICYKGYTLQENRTLIYSLKTDSWSAIPSPSTRLSYTRVKPKACFFNGILHWVVCGTSTIGTSCFILTFNLSSRVFGYILLPKSWNVEQVTTINGCLAVVHPEYNNFSKDDYSWIRVMKEYGNIESLSPLSKVKRVSYKRMTVFQPIINGDILAYFRAKGSKVFNTQTKLTKFFRFGPGCYRVEMDTYVESLELVDKKRAINCGKTLYSWKK
ncbi:F-box/kelch-repeat protein At3g06240-like [Bidens hawaiensis]|uniref:F-box/kelch-repeat protein At3g06240-like n=1 Tax=Bidens hawaiensis TaxID=980011 RepID=UPI004049E179